jgi:hypothetical protein
VMPRYGYGHGARSSQFEVTLGGLAGITRTCVASVCVYVYTSTMRICNVDVRCDLCTCHVDIYITHAAYLQS